MTVQKILLAILVMASSQLAAAAEQEPIQLERNAVRAMSVLAENPDALAATSINRCSGECKGVQKGAGYKIVPVKNTICRASVGPQVFNQSTYHVSRTYTYVICTRDHGVTLKPVEILAITEDSLVNSGASIYTFNVVPTTTWPNP